MSSLNEAELRQAIRGAILIPGDEEFDAARAPWNRAVDRPCSPSSRRPTPMMSVP